MKREDWLYGIGVTLIFISVFIPNVYARIFCMLDGWMLALLENILKDKKNNDRNKIND